MIAEADDGVGKRVPQIANRAKPHLVVRRRIHRRAVRQRKRNLRGPQNVDRRPDALEIVHARAENHGLAEAGDVLHERVVVALAGADLMPSRRMPSSRSAAARENGVDM